MDTVNERSTPTLTIGFTDEEGEPLTPTAATCRIDDVGSGTAITEVADLTELDDSMDLKLTEDETRILDETNPYETRKITVEYDYAGEGHGTDEYLIRIKNLFGVTTPEEDPGP